MRIADKGLTVNKNLSRNYLKKRKEKYISMTEVIISMLI